MIYVFSMPMSIGRNKNTWISDASQDCSSRRGEGASGSFNHRSIFNRKKILRRCIINEFFFLVLFASNLKILKCPKLLVFPLQGTSFGQKT